MDLAAEDRRPPASPDDPSSSSSNNNPKSGASRRNKVTSVACRDCQRRKTKCDGARPACSACQLRGIRECIYDTVGDQRRTTALRVNLQALQEDVDSLTSLLEVLQSAPEDVALAALRRLRGGTTRDVVAQEIRDAVMSSSSNSSRSSRVGELEDRLYSYNHLVTVIKEAPYPEVEEVVRRLRNAEPIPTILNSRKRTVSTPRAGKYK
ncbi:MAG: DEAH-box RNA helicase prp16 [Chaenotheca gracillima]|nr:MAG: DEAH-box RNA helicase prp16 [Chaenotheca gracillima]